MKSNLIKSLFVLLIAAKYCNLIMVLKTSTNEGSNISHSSSKEIFYIKARDIQNNKAKF